MVGVWAFLEFVPLGGEVATPNEVEIQLRQLP